MNATGVRIALWVGVQSSMPNGWHWVTWDDERNPLGSEVVHSAREVADVLRAFARFVAQHVRITERFIVTAYGDSGEVYGRDQWLWDDRVKRYEPHGEPWCPREPGA